MILFGGDDGFLHNETWALSLGPNPTWSRLSTLGTPPGARSRSAAIYDPIRDRLIVFGGNSVTGGSGVLNDTWALSFSSLTWTQLNPSGSPPPPRGDATAIYDPVRDRLVVYGGAGLSDVWALSLDVLAWNQLAPSGAQPLGRDRHCAVYDSGHDRMVIFGGLHYEPYVGEYYLNDAWALSFSGSVSWSQLTGSGGPSARYSAGAIYDPDVDRMVVFGGYGPAGELNDTWSLSLGPSPTWTQLAPGGTPPLARYGHAAFYNAISKQMFISGGWTSAGAHYGTYLTDVWALTLGESPSWNAVEPSVPPGVRGAHVAVYDSRRGRMIVAAGNSQDPPAELDVWVRGLDQTSLWAKLELSGPGPTGRVFAAAIYDSLRDRVLLFGGTGNNCPCYGTSDLWELSFDGGPAWTQLFPAGETPPARYGHTAIYDPIRDRMLIYGGWYGGQDVWALSLAGGVLAWSQLPVTGPQPGGLTNHSAVYDRAHDRMVIFGGTCQYCPPQNEVITLSLSSDPAIWSYLSPAGPTPSGRDLHSAIYDPLDDRMVVYGGETYTESLTDEVWALALGDSPTWRQLGPSGDPAGARRYHSAIFDPTADRMVVFGGIGLDSYTNDAWSMTWVATPSQVTASLQCPDRASLTWRDNAVNEEDFEIQVQVDGSGTWESAGTAPANAQSWPSGPLSLGHTYSYRVRACAPSECSPWSVSSTVNVPGVLGVPTGLKVTNLGTSTSLQLNWTTVDGANSYRITRSDGTSTVPLTATSPPYPDNGLTRGITYTYTVAAVNACGAGIPSETKSGTPDYYPVLLVHGICGTWNDFTDARADCFPLDGDLSQYTGCVGNPERLGDMLAASPARMRTYVAVYNLDARLFTDVPSVASAIDHVLTATGEDKINIVAHSQGGLIARSLLQTTPAYREHVANLIMIATPNHGTTLANLSLATQPLFFLDLTPLLCLTVTKAKYDLVPGCAFLNQLNYGNDKSKYDKWRIGGIGAHVPEDLQEETNGGTVNEWALMGTGGWCGFPILIAKPTLGPVLGHYIQGTINSWPNDGVVANASTRLAALASNRQWTDTQLDPAGSYPRATHFSGSEGFCNQEELRDPVMRYAVVNILEGKSPLGSELSGPAVMAGAARRPSRESAPAAPDTSAWSLLPSIQGPVAAGQIRSDTVLVDQASAVSILQIGDLASGLTLSLRSPSGMVWTAADTANGAVAFGRDPDGAYQAMTVSAQESGKWTVLSGLPSGAASQTVIVLPAVASGTGLSVEMDPGAPSPGSPVTITAALQTNGATVSGAAITGKVTQPDSSIVVLSFYDDGAHGDGAAGDGIYGASFTPLVSGSYAVDVLSAAANVQRESFGAFVLEELPDPAVLPGDIGITRQGAPGGSDTLIVSATIHNLGSVEATNALVSLRGDLGSTFFSTHVTVPAGGFVAIPGVQWIPSQPDSATLTVAVNPDFNFLESRTDNDTALVHVNPSTVSASLRPLSEALSLAQSSPNPSRGQAVIRFALPRASRVMLRLYDVAGREVRRLVEGPQAAGAHSVVWDGRGNSGSALGAGIYFYELRVDGQRLVRKAVLLR